MPCHSLDKSLKSTRDKVSGPTSIVFAILVIQLKYAKSGMELEQNCKNGIFTARYSGRLIFTSKKLQEKLSKKYVYVTQNVEN